MRGMGSGWLRVTEEGYPRSEPPRGSTVTSGAQPVGLSPAFLGGVQREDRPPGWVPEGLSLSRAAVRSRVGCGFRPA